MARGKKRTSFMKAARARELAEKRALKDEKRAARRRLARGDEAAPADEDRGENPSRPSTG